MRKITTEAIRCFIEGKKFSSGNTRVGVYPDCTTLYLHDNEIAILNKDNSIEISNAGWFSTTTKERLNGIPGVSIVQKKGIWYLNGKEWNGDWIAI